MNTTPETWREIAFSYKTVEEFLEVIACSEAEALDLFRGRSPHLRCFGVGFYFFVDSIKDELNSEFAQELYTLACRVEAFCMHTSVGSWESNSQVATQLLQKYFGKTQA
jgi:hypothetical protein